MEPAFFLVTINTTSLYSMTTVFFSNNLPIFSNFITILFTILFYLLLLLLLYYYYILDTCNCTLEWMGENCTTREKYPFEFFLIWLCFSLFTY